MFVFFVIAITLFSSCSRSSENDISLSEIHKGIDQFNEDNLLVENYLLLDSIAIDSVFRFAKYINYRDGIAGSATLMLRYYGSSDYRINPIFFYNENLEVFESLPGAKNYSLLSYELGRMKQYSKEVVMAKKYLSYAAIKLKEELRLEKYVDAMNLQGAIYMQSDDFDEYKKYSDEALSVAKEIDYDIGVVREVLNASFTLDSEIDFIEKERMQMEAFNLAKSINYEKGIVAGLRSLSHLYIDVNRSDNIARLYSENIELITEIIESEGKDVAKFEVAVFLMSSVDVDLSKTMFKELLADKNSNFLRFEKMASNYYLYEQYENENQLDSAFYYYQNHIDQLKEIEELDREREAIVIKTNYQGEEVTLKKINISLKSRLAALMILFIAALISAIFYFINQSQKKKVEKALNENEKLKSDIELLNQELATSMLNEMRVNERSRMNYNLLLSARNKLPFKYQDFFNEIISLVKLKDVDIIWRNFEKKFIVVNPFFFEVLESKHPNLTENDKRLSAFIFLTMTSKEISVVTGKSTSAIEQSRTRLRKKMNITNSKVSISNYLISLNY